VASCLELGQVVTAGQAARLGQAFAQQPLRNSDKALYGTRYRHKTKCSEDVLNAGRAVSVEP
jgi:hypothetical protein